LGYLIVYRLYYECRLLVHALKCCVFFRYRFKYSISGRTSLFPKDEWNELKISFQSPVEFAQKEFERQARTHHYPVPPKCVPAEYRRGENLSTICFFFAYLYKWEILVALYLEDWDYSFWY
jgi:hypothetical protein